TSDVTTAVTDWSSVTTSSTKWHTKEQRIQQRRYPGTGVPSFNVQAGADPPDEMRNEKSTIESRIVHQ
ncbi:hypothetical protein, partial [Waltera sp.]|uniref:hypothetical protein n=1 Tax=Waltera sp. TaxID=2815806 RepID=UPI003079A843